MEPKLVSTAKVIKQFVAIALGRSVVEAAVVARTSATPLLCLQQEKSWT
jgi:hypothetical protein